MSEEARWLRVPLGEVASSTMGQSPPSTTVVDLALTSGVPFLQGNAEFGDVHPSPRFVCTRPARMCSAGEALISVRAPVGAMNRADQSYCIGRGLAAVAFEGLESGFGWHALVHAARSLRKVAQGSTFEAIGKTELAELLIDFPADRRAQRRIAEILDRIDDAIRSTERVIAKLEQMKQGLLHDLLSYGINENWRTP